MPQQNGWTLVEEPKGWTLVEPAKKDDAPQGDLGRFGGYKMIGDAVMGAGKYALQHPVQSLAALGGVAGATATAPASLPLLAAATLGAGIGGAGGAGLGSILNAARGGTDGPTTAGGTLQTMAGEGAGQAAAELTGRGVVAPMVKGGARILMDNAVRPTAKVLGEFPDVVNTLIKERLPVGRMLGSSGSQQAKAALRESAGTTRNLLRQADASGAVIQPSQTMSELPALAQDAAKSSGLPGGGTGGLADMEAEFAATQGFPQKPTEVKDLKRAAQSLAKPVFRAQQMGNVIGPDASLGARFNDAIAGGSKKALEDIPQYGPRIAESEGRTQSLIGATKTLRQAEARRLPLWSELGSTAAGGAVGAYTGDTKSGVGTALAIRALTSPRSMSRAALGIDAMGPLSIQGPRLAAALLAALGHQQE